jgi:uncharacterized protein
MIPRLWEARLRRRLRQFPVVGLVGSRQAGKTTLARSLASRWRRGAVHLDLERPTDRTRLREPELFLSGHERELVVLDEIQAVPELFPLLRVLVDRRRTPGRFLVLGSASPGLLRQSSESLAGRIAYVDLPPFVLPEVRASGRDSPARGARLWIRGGYPGSFLARSEEESLAWREAFLQTHLERDLPQFGIRVPAERMRRFWQMLAHWHGQLWNGDAFARNFDTSAPTVRHYLDVLTDTRVVRQLRPWHANVKKRLVKSPKVYVRDSGLLHVLLGVRSLHELQGHPSLGPSFEGFAVEQILDLLPPSAEGHFYRTHAGAELDLVLSLDSRTRIGVEIRYTAVPKLRPGMREAMKDLGCARGFLVTAGHESFPLASDVQVLPLGRFLEEILLPRFHR